jgi:hypothetical protein
MGLKLGKTSERSNLTIRIKMTENPASYFKKYRLDIGFRNQTEAKEYLSAKDLSPNIDFEYIEALNGRISGIIFKVNSIVSGVLKREDVRSFNQEHINKPYLLIKDAGLLPRLNNQGRRPEEVLFSWLRGYAISEYFTPALSEMFSVELPSITKIGDDDLRNIETFKRTPKADLEITQNGKTFRIEVQSGFQGINDIKEHKLIEARRIFRESNIKTLCIHIDLFNGQVAFVQLDAIQENDIHMVTRQQMEGQSVFSIDQNYFKWRLLDLMPTLEELEIDL